MRFKIVEIDRCDPYTIIVNYVVYHRKHWWNKWVYSSSFYSKKEAEKYIKENL